MISVFKPALTGPPTRLLETLESSWWGTGPRVAEFESAFSSYLGIAPERTIMLNSCTAALHLALLLWPGCRRVLVPAVTFVSSALPAVWEGKELIFVDVGEDLCIDQGDALRKLEGESDVIIAVHMGGHVADLSRLRGYCLIEDCAHALGSFDDEDHVGTLAPGCFSFQATKILPIGDGGMVTLSLMGDRKKAEALAWCGISTSTWARTSSGYRWRYDVQEVGYKYRANDVMAALALDQWHGLAGVLASRRRIAEIYGEALTGLDWLQLPRERPGTTSSWQEYIVKTPLRDGLAEHLKALGIATTVHYYPINRYEPLGASPQHLPNCARLWQEILTIPSYASMTEEEIEQVIDGVRSFRP